MPTDVEDFTVETIRLPLSDGCELFGRLWLATASEGVPVPAILNAHPYGIWASSDDRFNASRARHGYAAVRIDLRGTGNSDGIPEDEYSEREHADLLEVIAWIADQPWCVGSVGMVGISWSGFNSLQLTALRPPALKAVVSVCSTDDRYADDLHYLGGAVLGEAGLTWATPLLATHARPPDPRFVGGSMGPTLEGTYRKCRVPAGSVARPSTTRCVLEAGIGVPRLLGECPVLMVGGWADTYARGVLRTLAGTDRAWGIVGP